MSRATVVGWLGFVGALALGATAVSAQEAAKPRAPAASLEEAYKRELAFLEAEKRSLEQRLAAVRQQAAQKVAAAKSELERLQGQSLASSLEADRLADKVMDAERRVERMADSSAALDNMLGQVESRLSKENINLPDAAPGDAQARARQIVFAFEQGVALLAKYSAVRKESGSFFAADGNKVDGQLLHLGRIASYGAGGQVAGVLAPAGEGKLKIWPSQSGHAAASAVLAGKLPEPLPIYLYDSLDKDAEQKKVKTFVEYTQGGGVVAWVIVCLGSLVVLLGLLRVIVLSRASANMDRLLAKLIPLVAKRQFDRAIEVLQGRANSAARVLRTTLEHIHRPREQLEDVVSEAMLHEESRLDRFGTPILIGASVAPLLGLLGTVTGMISTFDIITEYGTGNPKLLSGGISEALITTEYGLKAAIPAFLLGALLNGWAEKIKTQIEKGALRITNVASGVSVADLTRKDPTEDSASAPASAEPAVS